MVDKNKEERGYKEGNKKKTIILISSIVVLLILMAALFIFLGIKLEENISDESTNDSINADNKEGVSIKENDEESDTPKSKDSQENSEAKKNYIPSECSNTSDLCSCLEEYISLNGSYNSTNKEVVINNTGEMPIKDAKIDVSTYMGNESSTISKSRSRREGWPDYGLFPGEECIVSLRRATENFKYYRITDIKITPFVLKEKTIDSFDTVECSESNITLKFKAWPNCSLVDSKKNCVEEIFPEECPKFGDNCDCLKNHYGVEILSYYNKSKEDYYNTTDHFLKVNNTGEIPINSLEINITFKDNETFEMEEDVTQGPLLYSGESRSIFLDGHTTTRGDEVIYDPSKFDEVAIKNITINPILVEKAKYDWEGHRSTFVADCGEENPDKIAIWTA